MTMRRELARKDRFAIVTPRRVRSPKNFETLDFSIYRNLNRYSAVLFLSWNRRSTVNRGVARARVRSE